MKDVRIVIVSWNVEKLLERCLRTLHAACDGIDWEVVVVDNASSDKSVELTSLIAATDSRIKLIRNKENRGFARACNQGIAGSEAEFVLLLNPDSECPPVSITRLVLLARQRPEAGIFGPRLHYADCRYQESVRRFPTVGSQVGILLKLHHVFPWLSAFKRYFAADQNGTKELSVDQVMGACFLIRRQVIEQLGGLDERYFIWFEEVDYCRQAKQKGWDVRYLPQVAMVHHGGQSFDQVFSRRKQMMFNQSLIWYFKKWHPGWRVWVLQLVQPNSLALAWFVEIRKRPERQWVYWLFGIFAFEALSLMTVFWPQLRAATTIAAGVTMFILAHKRPHLGLALLFLELAIGSKGALLKIPVYWEVDGGMSVREVLTASFYVGWLTNSVSYWMERKQELRELLPVLIKDHKPWIALGLLVIWGIIRGAGKQNIALMQDANAWFFLLLIFPVLCISWRYQKCLIRHAGQMMIASLVWLPFKALGLLYVFSHGLKDYSRPLYLWLRRTGVGEATLITGNLFRIFLQSQVYAVAGFLFGAAWLMDGKERDRTRLMRILLVATSISLIIGLSRSFWIGLFAGMGVLVFLVWRRYISRDRPFIEYVWDSLVGGAKMGSAVIAALIVIFGIVSVPLPPIEVGSLKTLFGSRGTTTDAAAESRWNLLPVLINKIGQAPVLGSGFGATVTYRSRDPRILAQNKDGFYTTHAFEWGWLDHWIKFGILGIPVMAWLLISMMKRVWRTKEAWWLRAAFVSALAALGTLHIFTPYLNHPLGFGFLLGTEAWLMASKRVNG